MKQTIGEYLIAFAVQAVIVYGAYWEGTEAGASDAQHVRDTVMVHDTLRLAPLHAEMSADKPQPHVDNHKIDSLVHQHFADLLQHTRDSALIDSLQSLEKFVDVIATPYTTTHTDSTWDARVLSNPLSKTNILDVQLKPQVVNVPQYVVAPAGASAGWYETAKPYAIGGAIGIALYAILKR